MNQFQGARQIHPESKTLILMSEDDWWSPKTVLSFLIDKRAPEFQLGMWLLETKSVFPGLHYSYLLPKFWSMGCEWKWCTRLLGRVLTCRAHAFCPALPPSCWRELPSWVRRQKLCMENGRATRQKEPGPPPPRSVITSLWASVICERLQPHDNHEFSVICS